jgi:hypothetical protein
MQIPSTGILTCNPSYAGILCQILPCFIGNAPMHFKDELAAAEREMISYFGVPDVRSQSD